MYHKSKKFIFDFGAKNVMWHTVQNLHLLSKTSTLISREICRFFGWKTRENVVVLDILAVDKFDFTRKIVKKNLGEKLVKMLGVCGFCQNWIFGQKFDFSKSVFWFLMQMQYYSIAKINCLRNSHWLKRPSFCPEEGNWKDHSSIFSYYAVAEKWLKSNYGHKSSRVGQRKTTYCDCTIASYYCKEY